jgi:Tol biopolymer transport system component
MARASEAWGRRARAALGASSACLMLGLLACSLAGGRLSADDKAGPERVTRDGLDKQRPMWSRDGKWLTFARHEAGGTHIWQYVMDPASPSTPRRLTDRKAPDYNGAFSPDGTQLLLSVIQLSGTQGNLDIALVGIDGKEMTTVAGDVDGKLSHQDWPSWSPDGKRFAFSSSHEGNEEIYTAGERRDLHRERGWLGRRTADAECWARLASLLVA